MSQKSQSQERLLVTELDQLHTAGAGYDVLRYLCLPELLGTEKQSLLYFLGKNLARKFEIRSLEDIYHIFKKLGWGTLELSQQKRKTLVFHLLDDAVVYRLTSSLPVDFRLEAGFLSEAIEMIENQSCECVEEIHEKIHQVEFRVIFTS